MERHFCSDEATEIGIKNMVFTVITKQQRVAKIPGKEVMIVAIGASNECTMYRKEATRERRVHRVHRIRGATVQVAGRNACNRIRHEQPYQVDRVRRECSRSQLVALWDGSRLSLSLSTLCRRVK